MSGDVGRGVHGEVVLEDSTGWRERHREVKALRRLHRAVGEQATASRLLSENGIVGASGDEQVPEPVPLVCVGVPRQGLSGDEVEDEVVRR